MRAAVVSGHGSVTQYLVIILVITCQKRYFKENQSGQGYRENLREHVWILLYRTDCSDKPAGPTAKANSRRRRPELLLPIPSMISKR